MSENNIFSGLKVVDLASFIAGPAAATILSDFGADVIKVEPPDGELWRTGHKIPPQPHSEDPYPFELSNRNKRGVAFNLKAASAQQGSRAVSQVGRRVHRQHAACRAPKIEARI
jgi:formyl-CoA transferase